MTDAKNKLAVVLFNLGGPDRPGAIRPFLFNLFNDPAIIPGPKIMRWCLAQYISWRRRGPAGKIYSYLGGRSPLLENTEAQAKALTTVLNDGKSAADREVRVFIAMRYWHPLTQTCVSAVKHWSPDEIILLPLYPQFSSTTTASSFKAWDDAARAQSLNAPSRRIICYPVLEGFIAAQADNILARIAELAEDEPFRVLFSAHGLPQRVIDAGDPYAQQIEQTARAITEILDRKLERKIDWQVSYQSRIGRLVWIKPYTDEEIKRAGAEKLSLVVAPIAFVSEHSETLVELDIEYEELAKKSGVSRYLRANTVMSAEKFISGLADLVNTTATRPV